jgi:hypothetical protein
MTLAIDLVMYRAKRAFAAWVWLACVTLSRVPHAQVPTRAFPPVPDPATIVTALETPSMRWTWFEPLQFAAKTLPEPSTQISCPAPPDGLAKVVRVLATGS